MEVIEATLDDIGGMADAAKAMHAEDPMHQDLPFDWVKAAAWAAMHVNDPEKNAWVVKNDKGKIVGGVLVQVQEYFWGVTKVAHENTFYVYPEYRGTDAGFKLMATLIEWAKSKGAERHIVTVSSHIGQDRALKFLEKFGFKPYAVSVMLENG